MASEIKRPKFRLNNPKDLSFLQLPDELFIDASRDEKESVVAERKSVSYWADAWRRFKANKVAMVALVVFVLV